LIVEATNTSGSSRRRAQHPANHNRSNTVSPLFCRLGPSDESVIVPPHREKICLRVSQKQKLPAEPRQWLWSGFDTVGAIPPLCANMDGASGIVGLSGNIPSTAAMGLGVGVRWQPA
jgi:hypothetical protein